jgi:hypothetical protein
MSTRIRAHIRNNVVGYIALFLVLTGGTAQALQGSNTVFSDDIVNRDVKTADLGVRAVTANRLAPNSVGSGRVVDESLTGADIGNLTGADVTADSLTGADIDEPSLGEVTNAAFATNSGHADTIAPGSVLASRFGAITRRVSSVIVPGGGTGQNGSYDTEEANVACASGEMALNGQAFWLGVSGGDDQELWISEFFYGDSGTGTLPNSLHVLGGNDTGTTHKLYIAVYCLEP